MVLTDILVITGLSGAGRSQAADHLEDLDWFVVDNLPTSLFEKIAELGLASGSAIERLALVVGSGAHQSDIVEVVRRLRNAGDRVRILFLDASDAELVRRYGSTRRKHPLLVADGSMLAADGSVLAADGSVLTAIQQERSVLEPLKAEADLVVDTTGLTIHQLKAKIVDAFGGEAPAAGMRTTIESFGFKHGLPLDVDLVLDCRFLPNPYWDPALRPLSGLDEPVRDFVLGQTLADGFLTKLADMLDLLLPAYVAEGKSYLTVAIGCTGGRHRSVAVAEELAVRLRRTGHAPVVAHRDLHRG